MQGKKLFILFLIGLMFISFVPAQQQSLDTVKRGDCINLIMTCDSCSYNNITRVLFPNRTVALTEVSMDKDGTYYNHTFCLTQTKGNYIVLGHGDLSGTDTVWDYDFEVTGSGGISTTGNSIMHGIILFVLMFFLAITFFFAVSINGKNEFQMGKVIKVNYAKYLKQGLFFISYLLLTFMFGMIWVISENYLNFDIGTAIFQTIFTVLWIAIFPIFIMFVIFSLIKYVLDLKLENLHKRNLSVR